MRIRAMAATGEKGLEETLDEIAIGLLLVWKESPGYRVIRYTEGL